MRLITIGDSATSGKNRWPQHLAEYLGCDFVNLAIPAAHNLLQIQIMKDFILNNDINENDIIIWQIGYSLYPLIDLNLEEHWVKIQRAERLIKQKILVSHYHERQNIINKEKRATLTYISPLLKTFANEKNPVTESEVLHELLFMFTIIKKLSSKLLVFIGTDDMIDITYWETLKEYLKEKDIPVFEECGFKFIENKDEELLDCIHPTENSHHAFAIQKIYPKLNELGWLN